MSAIAYKCMNPDHYKREKKPPKNQPMANNIESEERQVQEEWGMVSIMAMSAFMIAFAVGGSAWRWYRGV